MFDAARQKQQFAGPQGLAAPVEVEFETAFQALHGDLTGHRVRRQSLACRNDQANDFEVDALEQRRRARFRQGLAERPHVD